MNGTSPVFAPTGHTCLVSRSVLEGASPVKWLARRAPQSPFDTGWQLMSEVDTSESLAVPGALVAIDWAQAVGIEPALGVVGNLPVNTSLAVEPGENGRRILDTRSGTDVTAWAAHSGAYGPGAQHPQASAGFVAHAGHSGYPAPPRRRTGMFTAGLILTILGGLAILGKLQRIVSGREMDLGRHDFAYVIGYNLAGILLTIGLLATGIVLLVVSRRR